MENFLDLLNKKGYKPYRFIKNKFVENKETSFSSMTEGGLAIFYVKDNDFDNPIIWGLHEYKKPPTLIRPRPKIIMNQLNHKGEQTIITEQMDDAMNIVLKKETAQDIFDAIFDGRQFDYTKE